MKNAYIQINQFCSKYQNFVIHLYKKKLTRSQNTHNSVYYCILEFSYFVIQNSNNLQLLLAVDTALPKRVQLDLDK